MRNTLFVTACDTIANVALLCGRAVQAGVQKLRTSTVTYTQYPQPHGYKFLKNSLCTFYELLTHHFVHKKSMQFVSVGSSLYTQSTRPTITTTYINK